MSTEKFSLEITLENLSKEQHDRFMDITLDIANDAKKKGMKSTIRSMKERMKVSYIAHPIGGNVSGNLEKVQKIIREINLLEPDVIPFAHYFVDCHALDDNVPEERERGIKNDIALMKKGFIDEVRLYGDRISTGMAHEIKLAHELGIPVRPMTKETLKQYKP